MAEVNHAATAGKSETENIGKWADLEHKHTKYGKHAHDSVYTTLEVCIHGRDCLHIWSVRFEIVAYMWTWSPLQTLAVMWMQTV